MLCIIKTPQYQGHIIDLNEEDGPQRVRGGKGPLLSGLILGLVVFVMIVTAFWTKSFGAGSASVSSANPSVTPSLVVPNPVDFPLVIPPPDGSLVFDLSHTLPGWKLVYTLDSLSNTGEDWTTLLDQPSQLAVHLICYGYDEILVTIEPTDRNVDSPYLTQSAIFYCQPNGEDARIIFDQGSFNKLMIMPMHDPFISPTNDRWMAGIEEPLCGSYTGALPGAGIDTCPGSSVSPAPVNPSSAPTK
jgi:hypothetical protein